MTTKQSDLLATKPETKKALAILKKFASEEKTFKELELKKKEAEATLLEAMVANDIVKLEGDWGYITKAVRKSFSTEVDFKEIFNEIFHFLATHSSADTIALENKLKFVKLSLDTTKVNAHTTLTGQLPEGVTQNETPYITKKFKS